MILPLSELWMTIVSLHNCDPPTQPLICSCPGARVGLERTFSENVGVVELCVVVYEPNITCPIEFPFNIRLSTDDGAAGMISCATGLTSSALHVYMEYALYVSRILL